MSPSLKHELSNLLSRHDVDFPEEYKECKAKLHENPSLEIDF